MTTRRRVQSFQVPVDDQPHTVTWRQEFHNVGRPVLVTAFRPDLVEFWVETDDDGSVAITGNYLVVATGHPVPDRAIWQGSCVWTADPTVGPRYRGDPLPRYIWHLYLIPDADDDRPTRRS